MSKTLTYKDSITRTGYTTIDGKMVVQHTCTINTDNLMDMSLSSVKIDKEAYKENRALCRADIAEFEDEAYELQAKYLSAAESTEGEVE